LIRADAAFFGGVFCRGKAGKGHVLARAAAREVKFVEWTPVKR